MGHFRLDVDPGAVAAAGRRLAAAGPRLDAHARALDDLAGHLPAAWEGAAADAAVREAGNLAGHATRSAPHFTAAGEALARLAEAYEHAEDVTLRDLNRRWEEAHDAYDAAVAAATSRRATALGNLSPSIPGPDRAEIRRGIEAAATAAIGDAAADLRTAKQRLEDEYDDLVEELRRRTRQAGDALQEAVIVPVPALTVAIHAGLGGLAGLVDPLLPGPDVVDALGSSLPLGTLPQRIAQRPADDPDALAALLAEARLAGLDPAAYAGLVRDYWRAMAFRDAGIDPARWDPSLGADANREIIEKVYEFYGRLYLEHPELWWAGMANAIGPSFAAGFFDLALLRRIGTAVSRIPPAARGGLPPGAAELAGLTAADIRFYETTLLEMQRDIFLDQGAMHRAYVHGGLPALEEMYAAGLINRRAINAWRDIDTGRRTGDVDALRAGNTALLRREQFEIIADEYDAMRNHRPTGPAVTWGMTWLGQPSIPGARGYADVFPLTLNVETPGPERIGTPRSVFGQRVPSVSFDNPAQVEVEVETPFPDGNIASRDQRWQLITTDTLPAYLDLVENRPGELRALVETPVSQRIEESRMRIPIDEVLARLDDWELDVDQ
jgi:hypothetical protein